MNQAVELSIFDVQEIPTKEIHDIEFLNLTLEQKVDACIATVRNLVLEGKHLVLSTSYGKDSSVMLAITLEALRRLVKEGIEIPEVLVAHSDTLLENPKVNNFAKNEVIKTRIFMKKHNIPGRVDIVHPNLSNDYLVNMIGGRTIASLSDNDAKCSVMMKVTPITSHKNRLFKRYGKDNIVTFVGKRWVTPSLSL